jgi:hypothetical protein
MPVSRVVAGVVIDCWMDARTRSQNDPPRHKGCRAPSQVDLCCTVGPLLHLVRFRVIWNEGRNPEVGDGRGAEIDQRTRSTVWFQVVRSNDLGVWEFQQHASGLGWPNPASARDGSFDRGTRVIWM